MNSLQLLLIGKKKKIKGLYNSRKSVQQPFMETKLNSYLKAQFTSCRFFQMQMKKEKQVDQIEKKISKNEM